MIYSLYSKIYILLKDTYGYFFEPCIDVLRYEFLNQEKFINYLKLREEHTQIEKCCSGALVKLQIMD